MRSVLPFILFLCSIAIHAQTCLVKGMVTDCETKQSIDGANIEWIVNSEKKHATTKDGGQYHIVIPRGNNITLKVSFVGYKTTSAVVNGSASSIIRNIALKTDDNSLSEVVVKGKGSLAYSRGDTTVYKAHMYKVNDDATAYDLLSQGKMPGLGLQDGKLKAHGEDVQEILLDGKEFFKNDIEMALKFCYDVVDFGNLFFFYRT